MELFSEASLREVALVLLRLVEAAALVVIFTGAVAAFVRALVLGLRTRRTESFGAVRLMFGRFLALGLEFQLAADLLRTAVAPSFEEIGKLAAVAAIRTALNFFLAREIREENEQLHLARRANEAAEPLPASSRES